MGIRQRAVFPGAAQAIPTANYPGPVGYGQNQPRVKVITLKLDNAVTQQAAQEFDITGDFLWAIQASDLLATINVQYQDQTSDPIPFTQGLYFTWPFSKIFLSWPAQIGKTITLVYAKIDGQLPNPFVVNPANALNTVSITGTASVVERPTTLADIADVIVASPGPTVIVAATATHRRRILVNTGANNVRIGAVPGATTGALLLPNGSITLMGNYQIQGSAIGGTTTVSVTIEAD